jgi:sugar transferase (PEP-CTERM/EpsH1 system associated)
MRILFLTHRLPYPPDKGERIRAFYELKHLAGNHEVDLYCFADSAADAKYQEQCRSLCRDVYVEVLGRAGRLVQTVLAAASQKPMSLGFFYSRTFAEAVENALVKNSYDLIFVNCSSMGQYIPVLTSAPIVVDFVDADSSKWQQYARTCRPPKSWLFAREARLVKSFEQNLLHQASLSLAVTGHDAEELRNASSGRCAVEVVSNGVEVPDVTRFEIDDSIRCLQPFVVFVGTMSYRPNADAAENFARAIFPKVRRRYPELQFVIVGRDPAPQVCRLGAIPGVQVLGSVPDVYPYFRHAELTVAPFRISQGFHNKIVESLAVGTPVITSSRAAAGVGLSEEAGLFTANSATEFVVVVDSLLADVDLRTQIRKSAPEVRRSLRWEVRLERLDRLIADVTKKFTNVPTGVSVAN